MAGDLPASHNVDGGHPVDDSDSPYVDDAESDNLYDNEEKYNIYAKQLFPLRHGYPLMSPASTDHNGKLVTPQVGDVGCLQEGEFIRLFNATALPGPESDTRVDQQNSSGILRSLEPEPFPDGQYIPREPERAFESHLCSDGVRLVEAQAVPDQGGDSTTQEATTRFTFECSENAGAFVRIGDVPATSSDILLSRSFVSFMQTNIERWYQHIINDLDFSVTPHKIIFVSGVTRAADWFTGAFSAKGREIVFLETPGGGGRGSEPRKIHRQHIHDVECKEQRRIEKQGTATPVTEEGGGAKPLEEQTLFFHYYKMKARSWPSDEDDYGCGDELEQEYPASPENSSLDEHEREWEVTPRGPLPDPATYDPVDYLLDYILDYRLEGDRKVQMAIASDLHIYALFPDGKVPLDIKGELYKLRPEIIFVHEEVACLAVAQWAEVHPNLKNSVANELDDGESGTFEPTGPDGIEAPK